MRWRWRRACGAAGFASSRSSRSGAPLRSQCRFPDPRGGGVRARIGTAVAGKPADARTQRLFARRYVIDPTFGYTCAMPRAALMRGRKSSRPNKRKAGGRMTIRTIAAGVGGALWLAGCATTYSEPPPQARTASVALIRLPGSAPAMLVFDDAKTCTGARVAIPSNTPVRPVRVLADVPTTVAANHARVNGNGVYRCAVAVSFVPEAGHRYRLLSGGRAHLPRRVDGIHRRHDLATGRCTLSAMERAGHMPGPDGCGHRPPA